MIDISYIVKNKADFLVQMSKRTWYNVELDEYNNSFSVNKKTGEIFFKKKTEESEMCTDIENCVSDDGIEYKSINNKNIFCVDYILQLDERRRFYIENLELKRKRINEISKQIGIAKVKGDINKEVEILKLESLKIGNLIPLDEENVRKLNNSLYSEIARLPNIVGDDTPDGDSEIDNVEISSFGKKPDFSFKAKEHYEICTKLGLLNFEVATKISGTRTNLMFGDLVNLRNALISLMFDTHSKNKGFLKIHFPVIIRASSLFGTGQLSSFDIASDLFHIPKNINEEEKKEFCENNDEDGKFIPSISNQIDVTRDLFLSPTGEVQMVNCLSDSIISEDDLPIRLVGYSECFRKEAGSGGKDVKGILRQKEFGKVELVSICHPDKSEEEHSVILESAESILQILGLHYRVVSLCSGDIGFAAKKTYDIEVWLPGQESYREVSSCSNTGDFQTRRANIKIKSGKRKIYAHALNGSGLAIERTLIAIIENYQNKDGTITVPDVLRPYMGGLDLIGGNRDYLRLLEIISG